MSIYTKGECMVKKTILLILAIFILLLISENVSAATGFGPAEVYTSNQRDTLIIGNATLINGDDVPKYGVFSIVMPYNDKDNFQIVESEIIHSRVLCSKCGGSFQRWEVIPDYKYGDPLVGNCSLCESEDLIFYLPMPRDEYEMLSLESAGNFHLEKVDRYTWRTKELISPGGACNVKLLYDTSGSYVLDNLGENWEVHLRGKTVEESGEGFMAGGIDLRILITFKFPLHITLLDTPVKGETFRVQVTYGPPDKEWIEAPEGEIIVDFNGVKETTSAEGIVVFTFPDTRLDYEYMLTAIGTDTYLSASEGVVQGMDISGDDGGGILSFVIKNLFVVIAILAIVVICVVLGILKYYFVWA